MSNQNTKNKKNGIGKKAISGAAGNAIEKGSELGGAVAGTAGGATAGAVIGGLAGSIVPGAGTVAGAKAGAKQGADTGANIGKNAGKAVGKGLKEGIKNRKAFTNPLDYFTDKIIKLIIDFFIPIPIVGEYTGDLVAKYKGQIALFCVAGTLIFVMMFFYPSSGRAGIPNNYDGLPEELIGYVEEGFSDKGIPHMSPFGGAGTEYTTITAYYHDPNYYAIYGRWHDAIDMVPNSKYYSENEAFKLTGDVVFFATCSGEAIGKVDKHGANYVDLYCKDSDYRIWYVHNKENFVPYNEKVSVVAGQPIAIMGDTGMSDGAHIHYAILKDGKFVDPYPYINKL